MHNISMYSLTNYYKDPCNLTQVRKQLVTPRNPLYAPPNHSLLPPSKATTTLTFLINIITSLSFFIVLTLIYATLNTRV